MFSKKQCLAIVATVLSFASLAWGHVDGTIGDISADQNPNMGLGLPETDQPEILISRQQYMISYNKDRRAPNWVGWELDQSELGNSGRSNAFAADTELQNFLSQSGDGEAVQPTDFEQSCFDRGHQIPSADRTDNVDDNTETFMMSNMIPQTPYLNRVIWEHLESYTRDLVQKQGKKVFVIAGPIYDADLGSIGPNRDIAVPSKDFKLIFVLDSNQTAADINDGTPIVAVIMPNVLSNGQPPQAYQKNCGGSSELSLPSFTDVNDWQQYQTTIADIESQSGLSFSYATPAFARHTRGMASVSH